MDDLTGVGDGEASVYEAGASEFRLPNGEGDIPLPSVGWPIALDGDGVAEAFRDR